MRKIYRYVKPDASYLDVFSLTAGVAKLDITVSLVSLVSETAFVNIPYEHVCE